MEGFLYGEKQYKEDAEYLWITGYIMMLCPVILGIQGKSIEGWKPFGFEEEQEKEGLRRMYCSYQKNPCMMLEIFIDQEEYLKLPKYKKMFLHISFIFKSSEDRKSAILKNKNRMLQLEKEVKEYFAGHSIVDEEFRWLFWGAYQRSNKKSITYLLIDERRSNS